MPGTDCFIGSSGRLGVSSGKRLVAAQVFARREASQRGTCRSRWCLGSRPGTSVRLVKRLVDAPAGRCVLHTWGGNGWQFTEVTVFGADGYSVREDMCGGTDPEPLGSFISRLTGLAGPEADVIAAETTSRWRDSGEEAEQGRQGRRLLMLVKGTIVGGASAAAAVAVGVHMAERRRRAS